MKKIKYILFFLLIFLLASCNISSSSSSSSNNSNSSSSSSIKTEEVYGTVPEGANVLTDYQAITYLKSSSWQLYEELYVTGVVSKSSYNSSRDKYSLTLKSGFQIYLGYLANGLPAVKEGDTITAHGKSMIYNGSIYELAYDKSHGSYPIILQIKRPISSNNNQNTDIDGYPVINVDVDDYNVVITGIYNTKEEVSIYIFLFNKLPSNYKKKSEFDKSQYTSANKLSTGGDRFYNKEGLLPSGKTYYEADIDYRGGGRNSKRIVYSSDLLIFYTDDHYRSFYYVQVSN